MIRGQVLVTAARMANEPTTESESSRPRRPSSKQPRVERRSVPSATFGVVHRCGTSPCDCVHPHEEEKPGGTMRRSPATAYWTPSADETVPDAVNDVLASPGNTLSGPVRSRMESFFGQRLGEVRVHEGEMASRAAAMVNSRAFAVGSDIVFGRGEYRPATAVGQRLLVHELTHVLQQGRDSTRRTALAIGGVDDAAEAEADSNQSAFAIDSDVFQPVKRSQSARHPVPSPAGVVRRATFSNPCSPLPAGPDCEGTIDVRAGTISLPALAVSHLYLVYTNRNGDSYAFRGGPDSQGGGYGHIQTTCARYDANFIDYDPSAPSVRVYSGPDACGKAACFAATLAMIAATNTPYVPTGPNSNSVVAQMLRGCGLPLRMPLVTAPGFNLGITAHGVENLGFTDRRQRLSLGLGPLFAPGGTETGLTAAYSVDVAQALNQTLRFPVTAGLLYGPVSGTLLGSATIGIEAPFLNVPFPGLRAPTSLGVSAGIVGGTGPGLTPGSPAENLLGVQGRAAVGLDLNRVRVTLFYQYEYLRSIGVDHERSLHMLGLEAGFTF